MEFLNYVFNNTHCHHMLVNNSLKDIKIYKCDNSLTAKESSQNLHCVKYRHVKRFGETDDTL